MNRRYGMLVVIPGLVLGLIGSSQIAPTAAAAAVSETPPRPSPQHQLGLSVASLPTGNAFGGGPGQVGDQPVVRGGWGTTGGSDPIFTASGIGVAASGANIIPGKCALGEPFRTSDTTSLLRVPVQCMRLSSNLPNQRPANIELPGPKTLVDSNSVWCSSTQWALPANIIRRDIEGAYLSTVGQNTEGFNWGGITLGTAFSVQNCPYVHRITLSMASYRGNGGMRVARQFTWGANVAMSNEGAGREYVSGPLTGDGHKASLCNLPSGATISPECIWIPGVGGVDPTDFDSVCAQPPVMEWLSWSWIPATIGHFAKCLFAPAGGFDREGKMKAAWESGPAGQIVAPITSTVSAFYYTETCGPLVNGRSALGNMSVNTCGWNSWGGPVKIALGVLISLMFGLWLIGFIVRTVSGVVNRKTPSPVSDGES